MDESSKFNKGTSKNADLNEEERTSRILREYIHRVYDIIDFLPHPTLLIDRKGRLIAWNKAAEKLTGVVAEDLLGEKDYSYSIPFYGHKRPILVDFIAGKHDEYIGSYRNFKKTDQTIVAESFCPLLGDQGLYLQATAAPLLDTSGRLVGAIESISDITASIKYQEELKLSEEKYRTIVETSNQGIWTIDTDSNTTFVNSWITDLLGYTIDQVVGLPISQFLCDGEHPKFYSILAKLRQGQRVQNDFSELICSNGSTRWFNISAAPIMDKNNKYSGALIVLTDLTENKKIETEMARLDRLNLVGQIAAGIGHEVRNPMTAVRGFLQMLSTRKEYVQDIEYFNIMVDELDRANLIITEFLSLAQNQVSKICSADLNLIIYSLFPLIQAEARLKDHDINLKLGNIPLLQLNEKEIRQLILNMVRNGLEAMEAGRALTIATYTENLEVILAISDQGPGIDPSIMDRLGTPFLTTKEQGTGLGLAVCYGIAERHNASIEVKTDPAGTTFYIRFQQDQNALLKNTFTAQF